MIYWAIIKTWSRLPSCFLLHPRQAGYVSGMLAPVGIGIMGALLIVGVLYSIRMIHRKRRNSFKHQKRKVRQPEVSRRPSVISHRHVFVSYLVPVSTCHLPSPLPATPRAGDEPSGPGHAAGRQLRRRVLKSRGGRPRRFTATPQNTTQRLGHNLHRGQLCPFFSPPDPPVQSTKREHFPPPDRSTLRRFLQGQRDALPLKNK